MKLWFKLVAGGLLAVSVSAGLCFLYNRYHKIDAPGENISADQKENMTNIAKMEITSSAFKNGGEIPAKYTCDGDNLMPPINISGVPKNTAGLALIIEDPDAPGKTWVHFVRWNIPADTREIKEGTEPDGVSGIGSGGAENYEGPCPPSGSHRYYFKFFATDEKISLPAGATASELQKILADRTLASGELMGIYSHKR